MRSEQIAKIVAKRQNKAKFLQALQPKWQKLQVDLQSLQAQLSELKKQPAIAQYLQSVDFSQIITEIEQKRSVMDDLEQRLMRDHLSIGVVGQMGQGKSRLLQSITQLSDDAIPTGSTGVCTSALSKIFLVDKEQSHLAEVEFYTWETFRDEVLLPYYEDLELQPKPISIDDFAKTELPLLPKNKRQEHISRIYGRFRKEYWQAFNQYRDQLTGQTLKLRSLTDLHKYLVHHRDAETRTSWHDMPVREVRIFHQFGDITIDKIVVMDLPGYGDNNAYDVKRLIKALRRDIDFILFIRMVNGVSFRWSRLDEELMGVVSDALGDFPIGACSYLIANCPEGSNTKDVPDQFAALRKHVKSHTEVQNSILVNCADSQAVQQEVLIPVLDYLEQNIELIYNNYLNRYEREIKSLHSKIVGQLNQALSALDRYGSTEDLTFNPWFDQILWTNLAVGMQKVLQQLDQKRNQDDVEFAKEIQRIITQCKVDEIIPSEERIEQIRSENKGSYKIAYYIAINDISEQLSKKIGNLNIMIENVLNSVKNDVANTLIKTANLDQLDEPSLATGADFFTQISSSYLQDFLILKDAFYEIGNHTVSFANMPGRWVRHDLDKLTPDCNIDPLSRQVMESSLMEWFKGLSNEEKTELLKKLLDLLTAATVTISGNLTVTPVLEFVSFTLTKVAKFIKNVDQIEEEPAPNKAQLIRQALILSRDQAVEDCHRSLTQRLKEPNYFSYEMAKKFSGQILTDKAETQWRDFLARHKMKVCPDCQDSAQRIKIKEEWQSQIQSVLETAAEIY